MLFLTALIVVVVSSRYALRVPERRRLFAALGAVALVVALVAAPRGLLLEKAIGRLAMPLGLAWLTLLGVGLAAWWRGHARMAALIALPLVLLTLAGNQPFSGWLVREVEGDPSDPFEAEPFDAVIVLGGGTSDTHRGVPQLGGSGDRVVLGARLYHRALTPLLVTSGSPIAGLSDHDSAAATAQIWSELGIPRAAIVVVDGARTTSEEARLHTALIRERGWDRVGVVSSASHLQRAMGLFEREGADVVPLAADVHQRPIHWRGFVSLIPTGGAARGVHAACWELLGRAVGR